MCDDSNDNQLKNVINEIKRQIHSATPLVEARIKVLLSPVPTPEIRARLQVLAGVIEKAIATASVK